MTATAALRAGAGLATVVTASSAAQAVVAGSPELMTEPAPESDDGSLGPDAWQPAWLDRKSVVAIGPGLGTSEANYGLVRRVYRDTNLPLVLDADALAAFAGVPLSPRSAVTVLTPHPGEMARLVGRPTEDVQAARVETARDYAQSNHVYLVLKGARTLIASPVGEVIVNPTGSPGMATAGSGDVLTGMITSFLAQFAQEPTAPTIAAAVYLHGLAGELAARALGEQPMLATDILRFLPEKPGYGIVWVP